MKIDYREHEGLKSINLIHNTNFFEGAKSGRIIKYRCNRTVKSNMKRSFMLSPMVTKS